MKLIFSVLLALVPGLFWAWYYLRFDKQRPEPLRLIAAVFFWGALATIPAIAIEFGADFFLNYSESTSFGIITISTLFIIAPIEELVKYLVVREVIARNPAFDEPIDAILYSIVAALGFATFENILVAIVSGQEAVILRFATATLLHAISTGIVGYHLAIARFDNRPSSQGSKKGIVAQGLLIAIVLHALYNIIASTDTPVTMILIAVLLITMFILLARGMREIRALPLKPPELSTTPSEDEQNVIE